MISFDDLVNVGGDTEQLENEMREIRLNTQVNRFSIIDCTNSIESLSSMISTITVADYSASLSSLSSDTLALYNSISTITGGGGGGFEYLEQYSAHSTESFIYNCNDVLSNQSFNETFKEVGPNINFNAVSFTTNQKLNLKGQTLNSCLIQSNTEYMMLNYESMKSNTITNNGFINISCLTNTSNSYSGNSFLTITGSVINKNTISQNNTFVSLNGYSIQSNSIRNNYMVDISGYSLSQNSVWGNGILLQTINCYEMNSEDYDGDVGIFCHHGGSKNTFNDSILDYTGYSVSSNVISARSIGHVKIGSTSGGNIGGLVNGGLLTLEVFSGSKVNVNNVKGYCDMRIGAFNSCTVSSNSKINISAKSIGYCSFDHNSFYNIDAYLNLGHNIFTNADSLKINAVSCANAYNTFTRISTLKYYIYTNARESFNSITELHLRDGNIFLPSRTNTLNNISKYIFKYTDGLYSGTDFKSDYSNIYNKAFIKYVPCSWLNVGGGGGSGGFDYWEGYVSHRQNGYNVSGTLKSALIVDNIYSLSPYANFSYCTFQSLYEVHSLNCEYFHTNSFFNNQTEINIKASEFRENTFENCRMVNVSACTLASNYYVGNTVINVSAHNMKSFNTFSNNDIVNITCYNTDTGFYNKPIFSGNSYVNILADNLHSGIIADNSFVNINCKTLKSYNIANTFNNITAYYIGNNTIAYHNTNINCLFNFSCSNFNDNSVQVRTNSFNLSALYMADNTFSNCSYLTINAGNISRLQLYSDSQAISTNRILKLKGNSIDSCNIMDYERVYLDCPIMKNIHLNGCPSIYLTTTYDFLKSWVYSSDYTNFNYSDKVIYGDRCSHFDFNDIDLVLDRFGGYSLTQIDKTKCYINGVPLIKLYPDA